jgi:hypothetical protein
MKLRTHLVLLALALVVSMILFSAATIVAWGRRQRPAVDRGVVETTRALTNAVDPVELTTIIATLTERPSTPDPV